MKSQTLTPPNRNRHSIRSWRLPVLLSLTTVAVALWFNPGNPPAALPPEGDPDVIEESRWQEIEKLVQDQKFQEALAGLGSIQDQAREAGDGEGEARALITATQLRIGLHGYETAVRELRAAHWPEEPVARVALRLYYAQSLVTYYRSYSWEIDQRERMDTGEEIDLKAWTKDQIYEEANAAFGEIWEGREEWGATPVGELGAYLQQNNYPARIRGTLRDTVTYMWVELLANSSFWSAAESNGTYRLGLEALLGLTFRGGGEAAPEADRHPVWRLTYLLADLEQWHRQSQRPEAAFEARLERVRRLTESFTQESDGDILRQHLEEELEELGPRFPWWSMGMDLLAQQHRRREAPQALVDAREVALKGAERHPDSVGGQRCRHLVELLELPEFQLTAMSADGPGQRSIQVRHRNLEKLYFRAYRYALVERLATVKDYSLFLNYRDIQEIVEKGTPDMEWEEKLPATPDYRNHSTYLTPPLKDPGAYLVVASMKGSFPENYNRRSAVNFLLTDLVLVRRSQPAAGIAEEAVLRFGSTGAPVPDAKVDLYRFDWQKGHRRVSTWTTDEEGVVRFTAADREASTGNYFLLARHGEQLALDPQALGLWERRDSSGHASSLLYTDRSIYRPGQTIQWKAVLYSGDRGEGRLRTLSGHSMTVELLDANGEAVAQTEVQTNDYGTTSGTFQIPASGRLLGQWQLKTSWRGRTVVQVEEYKRPTFEVTLADPEGPLRLNREARFSGEARYYFGLPVPEGAVRWRVTREPVYPRWWFWYSWFLPPQGGREVVAAGDSTLDPEGRFHVTFTPEVRERPSEEGVSYRYQVAVEVVDEGGETRSTSRSFRLGFVAVEAEFQDPQGFYLPGQEVPLSIRRSDLDGIPRSGEGRWELFALRQPPNTVTPAEQPLPAAFFDQEGAFHTPGDRLRPRWDPQYDPRSLLREWDSGARVAGGEVKHGGNGVGVVSLEGLAPGAYRVVYTTSDAFGAEFRTQLEFLVSKEGVSAPSLPAFLQAEVDTVTVGGTARLLVASGLAAQEWVLEIYQGGRRLERRRIVTGERPAARVIEIPITAEHRGGLGFTLTAVRDHQLMSLEEKIFVPWDDRRLEVELATFRDRIRPGDQERWRVVIRGEGEALEAGAAEVLAYMYDRSLDLFAPHNPPDILSVYPSRTQVVLPNSTLGRSPEVWQHASGVRPRTGYPHLHGDSLTMLRGYGVGGMAYRGGSARLERRMVATEAPVAMMADVQESVIAEMDGAMKVANAALADPAPPPPGDSAGGQGAGEVEIRSNFAETAFWEPHLVVGEDGAAVFEFTVPDSVTEWSFWAHTLTSDLRAGRRNAETRSVKELLVRPYLPRFLREGDEAELRVVVNNAGEGPLNGTLDFDIFDPETETSVADAFGLAPEEIRGLPFSVEADGGTTLRFPVQVPPRVGLVSFKVTARAADFSDGELRPLPVLPGRMHLMQSRFAVVKDAGSRTLRFADLAADDDPTRIDEQLVVTLDAQLFYGVLGALPYLVDYPYECTEQTLNRFLSTGIVTSVFDRYPAVAAMAEKMAAERHTRLERWDGEDPNRKMTLEESPWLRLAEGGGEENLLKVLDPEIAAAQRRSALAKLEQSQTSLGAFPWWPGGPPSPYMTLYLLYGFSKALEFDVEVPQPMVQRAWAYMHRHYLDELVEEALGKDCCVEFVTFLNFVLSSYPEGEVERWTGGVFTAEERRRMLDFSFRHWREISPLIKGYLTLTLQRAGRSDDANLVFDSVMDSAKTEEDLGTYWAPEDRAWLWYNDTIESHALALRVLAELDPENPRRDGLVQWLFLNKHLNHWKSTRATAEVIYSLVHYLETEGTLGAREEATVRIADQRWHFEFEPDEYTGKDNHIVLSGDENVGPATAEIHVGKETPGYLFASATWHFSTEELPEEARGDFFHVTRRYFKRVQQGEEWTLQPLSEGAPLAVGDQVEVHLSLQAKHRAEYVHLRDPRGAGFEPETLTSGYKWDLGVGWYEEIRDSGTNFFFDFLPVGEYTFKYRLRAATAGTFKVAPATVQPMYAPEFAAYSSGAQIGISGE